MLSDAELKRIAHQAEINTFSTESLRRFEQAILSHIAQRVRDDEREACAKLIEQRGQRYVSKWMNYDDMETQSKAYAWEAEQHAAAIRARKEKE